ncbi:MAG: NrfD/PsrC family molybdoenzyme membrane anchor subunit [Actinomycetota bacterium]
MTSGTITTDMTTDMTTDIATDITTVTTSGALATGSRAASLRPFGKPSRLWWIAVGILGAVVLAGIAAWVVQLMGGMGAAGYNDHAFWALYIADVITFIGVSYGGAVVSAILRLTGATWRAPLTRLAEGTAVVTVLIGAALIIPHLGNPIRLWELLTRPNLSAPVFWDMVAVMTYIFASVVFFALPLVPDMAILGQDHGQQLGRRRATLYARVSRGWVGAPHQKRVLAGALGLVSIMIIPLAVSVHSVLAWAFASTDRPWWHESIWAPQFVVAALYSGVALVILVVAGFRRGYHLEALIAPRHFVRLGFILATFAATYLYLTFADILPGAYVGEDGTAAVFTDLLVGRLAPWFWMFAVVGGLLPLLLVALPWTRNVRGMVIASCLVLPMMWLKRVLLVIGPATYDTVLRTFGTYHFTWVSIAITLAAAAAVPLLLMLLFRVVPILSIDEIEEIQEGQVLATPAPPAIEVAAPEGRGATLVGAPGTAHRVAGVAGVLLLVAILGMVGVGTAKPASAATTQIATGMSTTMVSAPTKADKITITGSEAGGLMQLTATLTGPAGQPVAKTDVAFSFSTKEFGTPARQVPLGSATTDKAGIARLTLGGDADHLYKPTTTGPQEFIATYTATADAKPITASTTVKVTVARSAYHPAPAKPLANVGNVMVIVLFAIVAAIWFTLITQIWRVRRVCPVIQEPTTSRP